MPRGTGSCLCLPSPATRLCFGPELFPVASSGEAMLLEKHPGRAAPVSWTVCPSQRGVHGAVVMNCAPLYPGAPIPGGSGQEACDWLYVFVLSEDRDASPEDRLALVRQGLPGVSQRVSPSHHGLPHLQRHLPPPISSKTGAGGRRSVASWIWRFFAGSFAPALGLQKRFVGTEPLDPVTRQYNEALQASLPGRGIAVVELPRLEVGGQPVSASRVRACLAAGDLASCGSWSPIPRMHMRIKIGRLIGCLIQAECSEAIFSVPFMHPRAGTDLRSGDSNCPDVPEPL